MQRIEDDDVLRIIGQMRGLNEDSMSLVDELTLSIGTRKLALKYTSSSGSKVIFLTRPTIWKLRSFFLNKGTNTFTDSKAAEYLNDVFVDTSCSLELYEVSTPS